MARRKSKKRLEQEKRLVVALMEIKALDFIAYEALKRTILRCAANARAN